MKNLSDLAKDETPPGFRDFNGEQIPVGYRIMKSSGNVVPEDMSSGSHSAKRLYVKEVNGRLVEIGGAGDQEAASTVPESDDKEPKKRTLEENPTDEEETEVQDKKQKVSDNEEDYLSLIHI